MGGRIAGRSSVLVSSLAAGLSLATLTAPLHADELKLDFSGKVQTDLRFRVEDKSTGPYFNRLSQPLGIERSQNLFSLKIKATYGRFAGVAAVDMYANMFPAQPETLSDLSNFSKVQTFSFEPQALYVEGRDLGLKGLDLRVGQQIVQWGVGDQFNPTNNLNSDDLRDPLLFGKQQPNFMIKLDYWVTKSLSLTGVLVPVFRPALLPLSAAAGVGAVDRLPFVSDAFRWRVAAESAFAASNLAGLPTVVDKTILDTPKLKPENMQFAYRIAGTIGEQDIALSYYNGRTDFPQPIKNHVTQTDERLCNPVTNGCTTGRLKQTVTLGYPRMHVYGLNMSGQIDVLKKISDKLEPFGYRIEAALVVPQSTSLELTNEALNIGGIQRKYGAYDYDNNGRPGGGAPPAVVEATPFLKWVVGLDYNFTSNVYANIQWVHGLADEFGAGDFMHKGWAVRQTGVTTDPQTTLTQCVLPANGEKCAREMLRARIGDYLAIVLDVKLLNDAMLLRLFTMFDLSGYSEEYFDPAAGRRVHKHYNLFSKEGFSAVIYPEFGYNFGNGLELGFGALALLGKPYTKFGDPASGGSLVWTRGRYSF